jgi:hypothetical protein
MKLTSGGEHGPDQLRTTSRVPPEERSVGGSDPLGRQTNPELGNFPSRIQKEMGPRVSTFCWVFNTFSVILHGEIFNQI